MTICLDTPEQINAWVLISRVSQCTLHLKGYPVKGLLKWLTKNVPDCADARTIKQAYPRLLDYCDSMGVNTDRVSATYPVRYQILVTPTALNSLYFDYGIVPNLTDVEFVSKWGKAYDEGRMVIIRTLDDCRDRDRNIQMVKE